MALHDKVTDMPGLPWWSVPIQREIITPLFRLTALGGLPPTVREFDLRLGPGLIDVADVDTAPVALLGAWFLAACLDTSNGCVPTNWFAP